MKAFVLTSTRHLEWQETADPMPAAGEAVVALRASALNHRDVWIFNGQYAGLKYPVILGSDGAGVVESVGAGVDRAWIGREVIINPGLDWGGNEAVQSPAFNILGLPSDGTFATKTKVSASQLAEKPAHLSWNAAAALPLAGLTAYRALFSRGGLKPGEKVLITGIGGGVALFMLQFAIAAGIETWVTSGSGEKIGRATALGAAGGFLYSDSGWAGSALKQTGGFDLIVDGAGGAGVDALFDVAAPGARIVSYGATRGNVPDLALRKLFVKQISYLGSMMGSPADWAAMTALVARHRICPVISDEFALSHLPDAIARMESGAQFGKIVLDNTEVGK